MKYFSLHYLSFLTITAKPILLLSMIVSVSACNLIPSFLDAEAEAKTNEREQHAADNIDLYESDRTNAEILALKEELAALKPSINKLIALESDLAELIETVEHVNFETEIYAKVNTNEPRYLDASTLPESNNFDLRSSMPETLASEGKFSLPNAMNNPQSNIDSLSVASAPPLMQANNYDVRDKMQKPEVLSNTPIDKFNNSSEQDNSLQNFRFNQCQTVAKGEGFAMHIASFKNKESAKAILNDTLEKLNNNNDCNREALIANVSVNGQLFYSARIGSFLSKADATFACSKIKQFTSYCAVTINEGNLL